MKKFLLGLSAVVAILLPLSQNPQAHWVGPLKRETEVFWAIQTLWGGVGHSFLKLQLFFEGSGSFPR
jgi:hypothetical protein